MQHPADGLRICPADIVCFDKVVVLEVQTTCETDHELFADTLHLVHEVEGFLLEPGERILVNPSAWVWL